MPYSWMFRCVALVRTDVSEKHIASIIRVTKIGKLGATLAATSAEARYEEILALAIWRNIPEDGILYSFLCPHTPTNLRKIVR
jgi:hypothetical protein